MQPRAAPLTLFCIFLFFLINIIIIMKDKIIKGQLDKEQQNEVF
jgi:hypothetical protein